MIRLKSLSDSEYSRYNVCNVHCHCYFLISRGGHVGLRLYMYECVRALYMLDTLILSDDQCTNLCNCTT